MAQQPFPIPCHLGIAGGVEEGTIWRGEGVCLKTDLLIHLEKSR